ncbi:MAG: TIR domain-containing protein [Ktedonobacteraceae bacterium]
MFYTALSDTSSTRYTNAKVVLVGDSGVGKSGLGLVLLGEPFVATESTHGRRVWTYDSQEISLDNGGIEMRETLLWDLAGQPGYRLIHQLHLNEVAVALIVFDAHSETDPFAGVYHWSRALRLAQRVQGSTAPPMKVFLVAARMDRTGLGVSRSRVDDVLRELELDAFFETSAKDGLNITELATAIRSAISWDDLPKVSSTDLFQRIKTFLITEKEAGRVLSTVDDLYHSFLKSDHDHLKVEDLSSQFETCIGRVESRGLIRRLNFGNLILLQPELLDAYASALVNAVKDEPDGLGSIAEAKVYMGEFPISKDERLPDKEQEKLLLIAMVEDLLRGELALREPADDGPLLVFPSQSTRENPNLPEPEGKTLNFVFDGPVQNIYATLAVRLSHSGLFTKRDLWKNAVIYNAKVGGVCGVFLRMSNEGHGELIVFFEQTVSEETRYYFEEYIYKHLVRWALPESIQRKRIFACSECGFIVPEQLVQIRSKKGLNWINCPGCEGQKIWLLDREERLTLAHESRFSEMDRAADTQRDQGAAKSTLQGKIETNDFDVFLCHNNKDKPEVKRIGERLREMGMYPWLDEWELQPGIPWQRSLEQQITQIKSAAVFVGKEGIGPWQQEELEAFLNEFVNRRCPVIPVLLPDAPKVPQLPVFLKSRTWVDFRNWDPDPLKQLVWGITGERARMK